LCHEHPEALQEPGRSVRHTVSAGLDGLAWRGISAGDFAIRNEAYGLTLKYAF
jgi:hypothetical protein